MSIRMRHTRGHTGNRRSHHALEATNIVVDKETGNLRLPHRLDEVTGMYRGKQIAPARAPKLAKEGKLKGISTAPVAEHKHEHEHEHEHEHAHAEHENAAVKGAEGNTGKVKRESRSEVKSGSVKKAK